MPDTKAGQNADLEKRVIALAIRTAEVDPEKAQAQLAKLDTRMFSTPETKRLLHIAKNVESPDLKTLHFAIPPNESTCPRDFLHHVIDDFTTAGSTDKDFDFMLEQIQERYRSFAVQSILDKARNAISEAGEKPEEVMQRLIDSTRPLLEQMTDEDLFASAIRGTQLLEDPPEAPKSLFSPSLLHEGEFCLFSGPPFSGKSWLALEMVYAISTGRPWLGYEINHPGPAAFLGLETHMSSQYDRLKQMADSDHPPKDMYLIGPPDIPPILDLVSAQHQTQIMHLIDLLDLRCLVLDPFRRMHTMGELDDPRPALNAIERIKAKTGCAITLIHHDRKGGGGKYDSDTDAPSGHGSLTSYPTLLLRLIPKKDHSIFKTKSNICASRPFTRIRRTDAGPFEVFEAVLTQKAQAEENYSALEDYFQDTPESVAASLTLADVAKLIPHPRSDKWIKAQLKNLGVQIRGRHQKDDNRPIAFPQS